MGCYMYEEKSSMGSNPTIRIYVSFIYSFIYLLNYLFHIHIFSYMFNAISVNLRLTLLTIPVGKVQPT